MKPNPPDVRASSSDDAERSHGLLGAFSGHDEVNEMHVTDATSDEFSKWLAEKAIEHIRNNQRLSPKIAAELHEANLIGAMRKLVTNSDIPHLLRTVEDCSEADVRILLVAILADFEDTHDVQKALLELWSGLKRRAEEVLQLGSISGPTQARRNLRTEEDNLYRERHNLMWRIAGFHTGALKTHRLFDQWNKFNEEALALVTDDLENFFRVQERFLGASLSAVGDRSRFKPFVEKRIEEIEDAGRFSRTKVWLYLCVAAGVDDWGWVKSLLGRYADNLEEDMAFVRKVATMLRTQSLQATPGILPDRFSSILRDPGEKAFLGVYHDFSKALRIHLDTDSQRSAESPEDPLDDVCRRLFRDFGVLQWETMTRNLIQEYTQRDVANFHFLTELLDRRDQLLVEEGAHHALSLGEAYCSSKNGTDGDEPNLLEEVKWSLRECGYSEMARQTVTEYVSIRRRAFGQSLGQLNDLHPEASKLVIQSLVNKMRYSTAETDERRTQDVLERERSDSGVEADVTNEQPEQDLLREVAYIHDGELTFYSLLWTLRILQKRNSGHLGKLLAELSSHANTSCKSDALPLIFDGVKWESADIRGWLLAMGLLYGRDDREDSIATARWESFWGWLASLNSQVKSVERGQPVEGEQSNRSDVNSYTHFVKMAYHLPMKRLRTGHPDDGSLGKWGGSWAYRLWRFATQFKPRYDRRMNPILGLCDLLENDEFKELVSYELDSVEPLWAARARTGASELDAGAPMNDPIVNAVCRAAYLPAEYLLRQYQPYPLCMLIVPTYRVRVPWIEDDALRLAPLGLVFFTVVGDLGEPDFNCQHHPTRRSTQLSRWEILCPNWPLASLISGAVAGYSTCEAVKDFWRTGQSVIFHDVSKDFNALDRQVFDYTEGIDRIQTRIAEAAKGLVSHSDSEVACVGKRVSEAAGQLGAPDFGLLLRERFINAHIRAQAEGRFYEQPEWCVELLRRGTYEDLTRLINALVWLPSYKPTFDAIKGGTTEAGQEAIYDWARLFAFDERIGQVDRVGSILKKVLLDWQVSKEQFLQLFPRPRLEIDIPTPHVNSIWGKSREDLRPPRLLPLFVFSMRAAYQNAFLRNVLEAEECDAFHAFKPNPPAVTLTGVFDGNDGRRANGIRIAFPVPRTKSRAHTPLNKWPFKQMWDRQMDVYRDRNLAYPWTWVSDVSTSPDGTEKGEIALLLE